MGHPIEIEAVVGPGSNRQPIDPTMATRKSCNARPSRFCVRTGSPARSTHWRQVALDHRREGTVRESRLRFDK
jgi:hypothetical protein